MHVLVVYAHPSPDSFTHALLEQVTRGLDDGPHSYQVNARAPAERLPADVRAQQALVAKADGLIFIAPVFWMALPAILKGWFERVFAYGFAYTLTQEGWQGDLEGRVPLLLQEKALILTPTFFTKEEYDKGWRDAMDTVIFDWGLKWRESRRPTTPTSTRWWRRVTRRDRSIWRRPTSSPGTSEKSPRGPTGPSVSRWLAFCPLDQYEPIQ
jgi:NAD(P)H dehydrogenase (quinone)